jgi:hypothetical protein
LSKLGQSLRTYVRAMRVAEINKRDIARQVTTASITSASIH